MVAELVKLAALEAYGPVEPTRRADHWRNLDAAIEAAILAERERCAKIAEEKYADSGWHFFLRNAGVCIAATIRAEPKDNGDE